MVIRMLVLATLLFLALPANAERFAYCHDGDTCTLEDGQRVRFAGIDCPEIGQPFAIEARDYAWKLLKGRDATLACTGWSYNRRVCSVSVAELDLQQELVGWGLAYDYVKYSGGRYQKAEAFARKMKRGVWGLLDGGVRPWDYRTQKRKR